MYDATQRSVFTTTIWLFCTFVASAIFVALPLIICNKKKLPVKPGTSSARQKSSVPSVAQLKPRVIPKNPKEEMIAKGELKKGKHDYPTMEDVISDWDSDKEGAPNPKGKKKSRKAGKDKSGKAADDKMSNLDNADKKPDKDKTDKTSTPDTADKKAEKTPIPDNAADKKANKDKTDGAEKPKSQYASEKKVEEKVAGDEKKPEM